jgi:cytochrome c-type biogenesis protein CcmH
MYVSPEAEGALRAALARDPANEGALYYMGLMMLQNDRADVAFSTWRRLLNEGDPEAPWQQFIRQDIEEVAAMAGAVNFELPAPRLKGPSAADIEAASDMSADDREDFIRSMVAQLSDRLATEGGSAAEWARLISSYGILGEVENAKIIWTEAQAVFGSDQGAMEQLRAAAKSAGAIE